jgi:hypothetical protein
MNQPSASLPDQCVTCSNRIETGGYVALPARDSCSIPDGLMSGPIVEMLAHLMRAAARVEPCPWREEIGLHEDSYRAEDLPPPLGRA